MYSRNLSRVNISLQRNYLSPDFAASLPLPGYRTSLSQPTLSPRKTTRSRKSHVVPSRFQAMDEFKQKSWRCNAKINMHAILLRGCLAWPM